MMFNFRRFAAVSLLSAAFVAPALIAADAKPKKNAAKYESMDYGPFLSMSFVSSPTAEYENGPGSFSTDSTARGIVIKLDDEWNAGICFDADTMRMSVGWVGGPLWLRGVIGDGAHGFDPSPRIQPTFQTPNGPGWADAKGSFEDPRPDSIAPLPRPGPLPKTQAHYSGLYRHGKDVILSYTVNGAKVLERPSLLKQGTASAFARLITIDGATTANAVMIARRDRS